MAGRGYEVFHNEDDNDSDDGKQAQSGDMMLQHAGPDQPQMTPEQHAGQPQITPEQHAGQPQITPEQHAGQPQITPEQHAGQPQSTSGHYAGQPQMPPGQYAGQPHMAPGGYAGQPQMAPGVYGGQPQMAPGQYAGLPQMAPGQYAGQPQMVPGGYSVQAQVPFVYGQQPMINQPPGGYTLPGQPVPTPPMPPPAKIDGCPPGLEYLAQLDQVLIHQQIEIAEILTNIECKNKYVIKNSVGQQVFFASEESDDCMRICCGPSRGFIFHILDNSSQETIRVTREFKCCAGCCWCANDNHCSFLIAVEAPPETIIGYVRQSQSFLAPHFEILNAERDVVLKIRGSAIRCQGICCTDDIDFKIMSNDLQNQVGKVSKQWGGVIREQLTKADNFGAQFPMDLDVKTKAVVIASTFLIDFMFFENKKANNQQRRGY